MIASITDRVERALLVCFVDLSAYSVDTERVGHDAAIADFLDRWYERIHDAVCGSSGSVVKFIGDGALLVWPTTLADAAMDALLALRAEMDQALAEAGWSSRVFVRVHAGPVIAGEYGGRFAKRFDVIGRTVNVAARLPTRGVTLSPHAYRLLSAAGKERFKRFTPPVTYVPADE